VRHAVLVLLALILSAPAVAQIPTDGQWMIEPGETSGMVRLTIRFNEGRHSENWYSENDVPTSELAGLAAAEMNGSGVTVHFKVVRDAGTLTCEGWFNGGKGSGHFTYAANPDFTAALARRGIGAPTAWQQFQLTMSDVGVALVDELKREQYDTPTVDELTRMGTHGADLDYLKEMDHAGYRLGSPAALVRARDHGVDGEFVAGLDSAGFQHVAIEDLVRVRDHGVDPDYIRDMKEAGFAPHDLEMLVEARDHGVDSKYIADLKEVGYGDLTLTELKRARDHGVTKGFIRRVIERDGGKPSLDELIRLRDRGM
jgi:hypothetical protein